MLPIQCVKNFRALGTATACVPIYAFLPLLKQNHAGKVQTRVAVVTENALYLATVGGAIRRSIAITQIEKIVVDTAKKSIVIVVPSDYDVMLLEPDGKSKISLADFEGETPAHPEDGGGSDDDHSPMGSPRGTNSSTPSFPRGRKEEVTPAATDWNKKARSQKGGDRDGMKQNNGDDESDNERQSCWGNPFKRQSSSTNGLISPSPKKNREKMKKAMKKLGSSVADVGNISSPLKFFADTLNSGKNSSVASTSQVVLLGQILQRLHHRLTGGELEIASSDTSGSSFRLKRPPGFPQHPVPHHSESVVSVVERKAPTSSNGFEMKESEEHDEEKDEENGEASVTPLKRHRSLREKGEELVSGVLPYFSNLMRGASLQMERALSESEEGLQEEQSGMSNSTRVFPRSSLPDVPPQQRLANRLVTFYRFYDPAKLGNVDMLAQQFVGQEDLLFQRLMAKYGPEPTLSEAEETTDDARADGTESAHNRQ